MEVPVLLDEWPHRITLHVATLTVNSYGDDIVQPAAEGIDVKCRLQPQSTPNDATTSRVSRQFKILAPFDSPLEELSRAVIDDGSTFIVHNVLRRDHTPTTRHCAATLREEA
jgi:hypothetical protein